MHPDTIIGSASEILKQIRSGLHAQTLNAVREVLTDRVIEDSCRETGLFFRKRMLTPTITVLHMVLAALWPEESFAAAWQVMWDMLVSRQPAVAGKSPSSGSLSKARSRLPIELFDRFFEEVAPPERGTTSAPKESCRSRYI